MTKREVRLARLAVADKTMVCPLILCIILILSILTNCNDCVIDVIDIDDFEQRLLINEW